MAIVLAGLLLQTILFPPSTHSFQFMDVSFKSYCIPLKAKTR